MNKINFVLSLDFIGLIFKNHFLGLCHFYVQFIFSLFSYGKFNFQFPARQNNVQYIPHMYGRSMGPPQASLYHYLYHLFLNDIFLLSY